MVNAATNRNRTSAGSNGNGTRPPATTNNAAMTNNAGTMSNAQSMDDALESLTQEARARNTTRSGGNSNAARIEDAAAAYHSNVFNIVTNGGDISKAYTIGDRWSMFMAKAKDSVRLTQKAGAIQSDYEKARDLADGRILIGAIKEYKTTFDATLTFAEKTQTYLRERLEAYSTDELICIDAAQECGEKAATLDALLRQSTSRLSHLAHEVEQAPTFDQRRAAQQELSQQRHKRRMAEVSMEDFSRDATRHSHEAQVAIIQYASMQGQYRCVAMMTTLIKERGKYIDQVLTDYEKGANIHNVALLRRHADQCGVVKTRLDELKTEYAGLENNLLQASSLPDKDLEAMYNNAIKELNHCTGERVNYTSRAREDVKRVAFS